MSIFRAIKHQSHFSPITLRFKDTELERRFHAVQYSIQPYAFQIGLGFLVLMYMVLAISQIFFSDSSLVSNLGYVALGLIALLSFSYMDNLKLKYHYQKLLMLLAALLLSGVMLLAVLPGTQPVFHVTAMMLTLAWFWLLSGLSFANASIVGWSVIGIYGCLVLVFGAAVGGSLAFVFNALLLGALFATLTSYLAERRLRIEFLSQHRVIEQSASVPSHQRRVAAAGNGSEAGSGSFDVQLDNQIEWAKCLKQMTIELANINETEPMFSRLLEHISKVMTFDAAAVGRFRNERMVPLIVRDKGSNIAPDDTIKLLWDATLISQLRETKESYIGEADVGLLETSIHDGELTFGCRLDIPFFSQQRLNGVVTLLRKRPLFNDFDKNLASSMVFHGMFARRSAGLQQQLENMAGKSTTERATTIVEPATNKPSPKMLSADDFIEQAENTFRRLLASGQSVSLMLVELDQHEGFIDKYGELGRQQIFDTVVNVLQTCTAGRGLLGYYGKGSFAIQLPMSLALAKDAAENVRRTIESHVLRLDGSKTQVTVSIGVSSLSKSTLDFLSMLRCADLGLFMARDANGNTVRVNV